MMQADASLTLLEKHVHEAEMTWSEGRLKLAKNGFCDQHPSIQLRKKNWRGKEKILLSSCPRCDKEHELKLEGMRLQLEHMRQSLSGGTSTTSLCLPASQQSSLSLSPSTSPPIMIGPQLPLERQESSSPVPLLQSVGDTPTLPEQQPNSGLGNLPSLRPRLSRDTANTTSCHVLPSSASPERPGLPERSSSCRAVLHGVPEVNSESEEAESVSTLCSTCSVGDHLPIPSEIVGGGEAASEVAAATATPTEAEPAVVSSPMQELPSFQQNAELALSSSLSYEKAIARGAIDPPSGDESEEEDQKPAAKPSPDTEVEEDRKPAAKPSPDTDLLLKELERQRRQVGAVPVEGTEEGSNGNTLRDMTALAKYAAGAASTRETADEDRSQPPGSPTTVRDCKDCFSDDALQQKDPVKEKVNALKWGCKHPHEAEQVLHDLQALCQASEENQATVVLGEGLGAVMTTMKAFPQHAGVQEEACWVLGTLAYENDDHKALIAEAGGIAAIVSSMQDLASHAKFQEAACEVLTYLTQGHLLSEIALCECGGVAAIVGAMERHLSVRGVQEKACSLLGNLAAEGGHCGVLDLIAGSGGIAAMFAAMLEHKFYASLQESACGALGNLACCNPSAQFLIAEAGGVGLLLAAMKNHERDPRVLEMACFALQNIAHDSPKNKDMMLESGVPEALVHLIQGKRTKTAVRVAGCDVLITLIRDHIPAKDALVGSGAIAALVGLLGNSRLASTAHRAICRVLTNLSHNHDTNKKLIAEAGGITAVLACMLEHAQKPAFIEYACRTLTSLAVSDENKVLLAEACGIEYVVAGMGNHSGHAGVQESGCRALMNLAFYDGLRELIRESDGVMAVLAAMENHKDNVIIQEKACGALRELSVKDSNELFIVEAGGIEAVLSAFKTHQGHAGISRNACGALRNLSFHDESCKQKIAESIGFGSLFDAMEHFMTKTEAAASDSSSRGSNASSH